MNKILRLDVSGRPQAWLSRQDAAILYSKAMVRWEYGTSTTYIFGGIGHSGQRSKISMRAVIATPGVVASATASQSFSNRMLFRRDDHRCMYCGQGFSASELTRDHVHPRSRGGQDVWENVVAACRSCNQRKADRTPEEVREPLVKSQRPLASRNFHPARRAIQAGWLPVEAAQHRRGEFLEAPKGAAWRGRCLRWRPC